MVYGLYYIYMGGPFGGYPWSMWRQFLHLSCCPQVALDDMPNLCAWWSTIGKETVEHGGLHDDSREIPSSGRPPKVGTQEPIIFNQKHVQWKDTYIQKIRFLVKCHADRKTELVTKWYLVCFKETWVGEACEHHKATSMDESLFSTHPKAGNPAFDPLLLKSS